MSYNAEGLQQATQSVLLFYLLIKLIENIQDIIFFATFSFCQAFQNMFIVLYSLPLPFSTVSH